MEQKRIAKAGLAIAATGLFIAIGAFAQSDKMMNRSSADTRFAQDAAMGGMEEVELGRVAVKNGQSDKVKEFGQRMIDDHSKAGDDLKTVAAKDNIALPAQLDAKHRAVVDRFNAMSGAAFDRAYMRDMVKDHEMDIAEFQKEANNGSNADLKDFAGRTLPTIQDHLRMAREDSNSVMSRK